MPRSYGSLDRVDKKEKCRIKFNTQFSIYKNLSNKILDYYEKGIINQIDIDERIKNVGYGKSFDDLIQDKEERKEE